MPEINYRQGQSQARRYDLYRPAIHGCKGGPQYFMAAHDFVETALKGRKVEGTFEGESVEDVIERTAWF